MADSVIVKKSKIEGKGVFAAEGIKKDSYILDIDDSNIVTDPNKLTKKEREHYCDYFDDKRVLWPVPERHINHSCDPNVYTKTVDGIRKVFAMRDIDKGEELTFDYSINSYGDGVWECRCGSAKCRKKVNIDFLKLPIPLQKKYLPYLDDWFRERSKKQIEELQRRSK